MFCPRCGVAWSRAIELCSGCGADLRPLLAAGFLNGPVLRVPSGARADDADSVTSSDSPTSPDVAAPFSSETAALLGSGDATVEGPLAIAVGDQTVLARVPLALGISETDVTRLGAFDVPASASGDGEAPWTPSPGARHRGGNGSKRPRTDGARAAAEGPLEIGELLGTRYRIIRLLGIGGMGAVYQAWDSELEVALAFKVIRPDAIADPAAAAAIEARFKRELLLARQVTHPNVVRIHDLGEIDGIKYITMPYIEGRDLSDILAETATLPIPRVLNIAKQVASGLCAAHAAGVVHRDLKPANIMIETDDRALIMDFGIARGAGEVFEAAASAAKLLRQNDASATLTGAVVGTIEYMAPEQARGERVDERVDIYSFGMILYRMMVGKRLADGATDAYTDLIARMQSEPTRVREIDPTVPEAVERIVSKCLQPDPALRYQTTTDLLAALERLDENGVPLPEPTPIWRSWRFWSTAATLMAVLVAGTWWFAQLFAPVVPVVHDPVSVLIADFTNATGEPMFKDVLEQSLGVAVEGASFVTAYDRRNALRVASQLNAGNVLDEKVARVVAQREGVKVVLAGGIGPDGNGYRLSVRGISPADGTATLNSDVRAASKNDVLKAIGRLGSDIRKSLGDTRTARRPAANEMLSASSLEAVAEYMTGQELTRQTRDEEAIAYFKRATELDPNFGRAYSAWGTAAFKIGRQDEAEAKYKKALSLLDRMTKREQYRTLGVYYLAVSKNYDKAIENFGELVKQYPSDAAAYNNLAVAYTNKLDFTNASANGRKALEIYPRNRLYRSNYALYAMYAGDFKASAAEATNLLKEDPNYFIGYLPLAIEALARGDAGAAAAFYTQMARVNARAASLASIGMADLALVEGRSEDAIKLLTAGIRADEETKTDAGAALKRLAIAEAYEMEGDLGAAVSAATTALSASKAEPVLVPAGRIFAVSRQQREIDAIAKILSNQFEPQKRAYGRIVDGLDYLSRERYVDAADSLKAAIKFADIWLARFYLGVAYEMAGRHGEAISELQTCFNRRGEATALFLDEVPTYRYLAPLTYWLARAQDGLGQTGQARTNYQAFLAQKKGRTSDPLVSDSRRRLELLITH
jgi:serine/threonine protein kinase/tetratricopeptide (TPR) repeat protein